MSAPLRFLAVAIIGWVGVRAVTMGLPSAQAVDQDFEPGLAGSAGASAPAFPPIEQLEAQAPPLPPSYYPYPEYAPYAVFPTAPRPVPAYYYYPVPAPHAPPRQASYAPVAAPPQPLFFPPSGEDDNWIKSVSALPPLPRVAQDRPTQSTPAAAVRKLDRLQLSSWALLRGRPGQQSLAANGMLGGSQAGARLTYALDRRIGLSLRTSTPIGGSQGGEISGGVRLTPFPSMPVALTAERRQAIGRSGGRSAFALFVEGGVYERPILMRFNLDGYAQAGVVGARNRDLFAEGGFTLTRPLLDRFTLNRHISGQLSAGFGMWGGVQPGLYRVDAGPRLSLRVRNNMRLHVDWRQRLVGDARPNSGPALTLAGDF